MWPCRVGECGSAGGVRAQPGRGGRQLQASSLALAVHGELGGSGPRGGCGLVPASSGGPLGYRVERGDDLARPAGRPRRPGARPAVRVGGQGVRQGMVRGASGGAGCCPVDRGSHQRVIHAELVAVDTEQPSAFGGIKGVVVDAEPVSGVTHDP